MKKVRAFVQALMLLLTLGLAAYSSNLRAEDIDIYVDNSTNDALPNVLFIIDNSANLASTGFPCAAYSGTTEVPSLGNNTAGGIIQCALVDAIKSLPDGAVNIGILSGNANNFATDTRSTSDKSYHETCEGSSGGCLLRKLTEMRGTNKQSMIDFVKSWRKTNSPADSLTFPFTVTNAAADDMMQEAWAYYNGRTGLSGKVYSPSLLQGCQKNFIIYIGNTDKTPANGGGGVAALTSAGATTSQSSRITQTVGLNPGICGVKNITSIPATSSNNDWSSNYGDEWASLMFQQDGGTSTQEGLQNITTYTIGIIDNGAASCSAGSTPGQYAALLGSMAQFGGGKAFRVANASDLSNALLAALNEVQAVNSVFSSASLPVSVNAEGSYLNQIFLGMFRPDSSGAPRWMGNLKQYQLIRNSSGSLVMGDACTGTNCPKEALSSGGTGFLAPGAISFWTYKDTTVEPDASGGMFFKNKMGTPVSGYDSPDGEVVEKGGVAQQLRKANLTASFSGASGTSGNPRRVFTYCPQGPTSTTACVGDLTDATNDFATSNANISSGAFGSGLTVPVTSIVRTGTSALVTTSGNHGFTGSSIVTIKNAVQNEYNVTQSVTVNSSNTFTITGLPDYPTTPSQGSYTISRPSAAPYTIASITRPGATSGGSSTEAVTVTTTAAHPFSVGNVVRISGATPTEFNGAWTVQSKPTTTSFTFNIPIYPVTPAAQVATYTVVHSPYSRAVSAITVSGTGSNKKWTVSTTTDHGFHVGQTVTISGTSETKYNTSFAVQTVPTTKTFTIAPSGSPGNVTVGSVSPSSVGQVPTSITRNGNSLATTATVTVPNANWFANGDKVNIATTGTATNQVRYSVSDAVITCSGGCTSFTYAITTAPALAATTMGTAALDAGSVTVAAGSITRTAADPTTAVVKNVTPGTFTNGTVVDIAPTGGSFTSETGYVGTWTMNCGADTTCASFTFGPVPITPTSPATGTNIQAYSGNTPPDKDTLIKWLRGQDNGGDEKGPGGTVTVRPSVHGDVLHSRPLVINYGDSRGIVVFYGSNDGVYRAVNGNQTSSIVKGSLTVPAGGELWGLILPEHYQLINRYRSNSPEVKFPSSLLASAQPKDYFVDGPTGVYQKLNADGTINKAYIFLTMRRGGRLMYGLDVTEPTQPRVLWSLSNQTPGFEELGQTWSRPRVTLLQNYVSGSPATHVPVLVFGAGYDPAEDDEPPTGDDQGRGIFVINALTGDLIWSASASCDNTLYPCVKVDSMKYATPTDIAFVDRDLNGFIDKFYWGDLGGNVWRADVSDASVSNWKATRVAQLGCDSGECSSGTTPRKFFFPPAVLSIRASGATDSYEALSIVSGDREHPLRNTATNSAYNVQDKFFMVKDLGTTIGGSTSQPHTTDVTASTSDLFDATYTLWDGTKKGFSISLIGKPSTGDKGEKGVNAPIAVNGQIFFATNRPVKKDTNTCAANLGEARAYAVSPFTGAGSTNVLQGGGMPPSAVTGLISITEIINGVSTTTQEKFCIGCGLSTSGTGTGTIGGERTTDPTTGGGTPVVPPCTSALNNCYSGSGVPKNLKRTYWYKK